MKYYNRRHFIKTSAISLSLAGIGGLPTSYRIEERNLFKYALCNEILQEFRWAEQCEIIGNAGYNGVEIAPFTLVKQGVQEITPDNRRQMSQDMKNAGIECAGLHWLLTPPPKGLHFTSPNDKIRKKTVNYLSELIDFCSDLGGKIMVFGSPGQRSTSHGISVQEAEDYFTDGLLKVADHAKERNVQILIEPLSKTSTDVINTLEEAIKIVDKIHHPSVSSMFDFHHTVDETDAMPDLIRKYYKYIHHVHVQNMDGTFISPDNIPKDFLPVFKTLKELNFNKWISTEVFDFSPGGKLITQESMKTFKKIEKMIK